MYNLSDLFEPYLDVEMDVLIEETRFAVTRDTKQTMTGSVIGKRNKRSNFSSHLFRPRGWLTLCFAKFGWLTSFLTILACELGPAKGLRP